TSKQDDRHRNRVRRARPEDPVRERGSAPGAKKLLGPKSEIPREELPGRSKSAPARNALGRRVVPTGQAFLELLDLRLRRFLFAVVAEVTKALARSACRVEAVPRRLGGGLPGTARRIPIPEQRGAISLLDPQLPDLEPFVQLRRELASLRVVLLGLLEKAPAEREAASLMKTEQMPHRVFLFAGG